MSVPKPKLGSGARFQSLTTKVKSEGYSPDQAKAITATAGRKKYGKGRMSDLAKAGRRRRQKVTMGSDGAA